jgi:hypothetical protein
MYIPYFKIFDTFSVVVTYHRGSSAPALYVLLALGWWHAIFNNAISERCARILLWK